MTHPQPGEYERTMVTLSDECVERITWLFGRMSLQRLRKALHASESTVDSALGPGARFRPDTAARLEKAVGELWVLERLKESAAVDIAKG